MVDVVATRHLRKYREKESDRFPGEELEKLTSAVEAVGEGIFHNTPKGGEVKFDRGIFSHLNGYVSGGNMEYEVWDKFRRSVDLYNPDKRIAVEIEKTEKKLIWKNLIKFSRGPEQDSDDCIDFGCIIVPTNYPGGGNIFRHAANALEFTSPLIDIEDIVIIGYQDPRDAY